MPGAELGIGASTPYFPVASARQESLLCMVSCLRILICASTMHLTCQGKLQKADAIADVSHSLLEEMGIL